ncbi:hypothetical protein O3P69_020513 [Scylla paramamosain]|uniref:Uncharacterized protein n=1 Tax=Scylla paramamosain TaxID=85552 RepID=A0AAW0TLE9_SCYPA
MVKLFEMYGVVFLMGLVAFSSARVTRQTCQLPSATNFTYLKEEQECNTVFNTVDICGVTFPNNSCSTQPVRMDIQCKVYTIPIVISDDRRVYIGSYCYQD